MRAPGCSGWHVPVHVQLPNCACIGVKAAASRRRQRPATARHPRTFAARCARASAASLARRPHRDYSSPLWVTFGDGRYLPWPPTVRWHRMVGEGVRVLTVYGCLLITDKAVGHPRQRPRGPGINIEGANVAKEAAKKGSRLLSWQALAVAAVGALATMGAALIARTSDAPESPALSKVDSSDVAITSVTFETTPKGLKILVRGTASAGLSGDRWIFAIARPKGAASPDGAPRIPVPFGRSTSGLPGRGPWIALVHLGPRGGWSRRHLAGGDRDATSRKTADCVRNCRFPRRMRRWRILRRPWPTIVR